MTDGTRALTITQRTALQVDDNEAREYAGQLMKYAQGGSALFPKDLSQGQATALARIAIAYGLDPIAGELIPYQGRPYVTIDGRVRKAQENPAYDGIECNPATDDERKAFRCSDDEHLWIARVWRKDRRFPFVGYGRAAGRGDKNPVSQSYAQEMAQKRAKARALRDAFSMPLPSYEDEESDRPQARSTYYEDDPGAPVIDGEARVINDDTTVIEPTFEPAEPGPTSSQIKKVHTLQKLLKWDDDEYRDLLREAFGVGSSKEMTEGQASALAETMDALLENAAEEGRSVRIAEAVEAMKLRTADLPGWKRTQEKAAKRRAALEAGGFEAPSVIDHEPAAEEEGEPDIGQHGAILDEPNEPPAKETAAEKSTRRREMERRVGQYLAAGAALGMDLAPYEFDESTSDGALEAKGTKLAAAIKKASEAKEPARA